MSELKADWDGFITKHDAIFMIERLKYSPNGNKGAVYNSAILDAGNVIASLPESIVRCKDCRFHENEEIGMVYCPTVVGGWVEDNWFCKGGEREDE